MPTAPTLTITLNPPRGATLRVVGEIDQANADEVRDRLIAALHCHERLTIDVSAAMFLDITALRALRALHREAIRLRREPPALVGVRPLLAKALTDTGMRHMFPHGPRQPATDPRPTLTSAAA